MKSLWILPFAALAALIACAPAQPTVVFVQATGPEPPPSPQVAAPRQCSSTLTMRSITPDSATCWVDAPKPNQRGTLDFPCDGGDATLKFGGKHDFKGVVSNGVLTTSQKTRFPFSDGCTWESEQTVSGPVDGPLEYRYSERPVEGTGCASGCTARGHIIKAR